MRIVLFGPPGAGKGTQATLLAERKSLAHISTGVLLRAAMKEQTDLGREAKKYVNSGRLVPDAIVRSLAEEAIAQHLEAFILDGYPRTVQQAEWLTTFLKERHAPLQAIICMEVPEEAVVGRLSRRRVHRETGANYHLDFRPPPPELASSLVQRPDDRPEAIKKRLSEYHRATAPVISYYEPRDAFFRIDGEGEVEEIYRCIENVLEHTPAVASSR